MTLPDAQRRAEQSLSPDVDRMPAVSSVGTRALGRGNADEDRLLGRSRWVSERMVPRDLYVLKFDTATRMRVLSQSVHQ